MTSNALVIKNFMTAQPHAIEPHEPADAALRRMRHLNVLHMPVRAAGKTVGVLSERDLGVLEAMTAKAGRTPDFKTLKVMDVMTPDPFCVKPDAMVSEVARSMADQKIGSALVVDESGALLGIFTVTDALKALSSLA